MLGKNRYLTAQTPVDCRAFAGEKRQAKRKPCPPNSGRAFLRSRPHLPWMPTEPIRITVLGDNAPLSPNALRSLNRYRRAELVRQARHRALVAWLLAGRPMCPGPFPVRVECIIRRTRVMDDDNALGSLKAIRDELFNGLVIPKDSVRFLRFEMPTQETGKRWAGVEEVEFRIYPAGSP